MTDSRTREDQVEDEPDTASEGMQKKKKKKTGSYQKHTGCQLKGAPNGHIQDNMSIKIQ